MSETPKTYLISPPEPDPVTFGDQLSGLLDRFEIAAFRLELASSAEDQVARTADHLREICHARDVAIVLSDHYRLAAQLGLDGCHLTGGGRKVRAVRAELGHDAIVGAFCAASRHDGLAAGEAGADYVAFGPVGASALGDGRVAEPDLFGWWSDMIEVPVVAEGGLSQAHVAALADVTDFFGVGAEIWQDPEPARALATLLTPLR